MFRILHTPSVEISAECVIWGLCDLQLKCEDSVFVLNLFCVF